MVILHVAVRVTIFQFQKLQCISWWCDLPRYSVASVSGALFCCCRPWLTTTRRTRWKESFRKWKQLCRFRTRTHVCVVLFLFFFADSSLYFFYYRYSSRKKEVAGVVVKHWSCWTKLLCVWFRLLLGYETSFGQLSCLAV